MALYPGGGIGVRTMSLTSFLDMPDVRAKVKSLRPKLPRKISAPLKIEPRSKRYGLVGTAFDYLLRFELQRRAPHAISERWVADYAPETIWRKTDSGSVGMDLLIEDDPQNYLPPEEVSQRARVLLDNAKGDVAAYVKLESPTRVQQAKLAMHAIGLAKLDTVYRAWRLEPGFEGAGYEDIQDLVDLLAIAPFDELLHDKLLLLNPNFRQTSHLVGGADCDLITGDLLVDFKTTKKSEIQDNHLDQILGYFLLARKQRLIEPTFPVINRLGLYYCRHGYLWSLDASVWTSHPEFPGIEQWFFQRADEVFGALSRQDQGSRPEHTVTPAFSDTH
jgi:hypothetical protein